MTGKSVSLMAVALLITAITIFSFFNLNGKGDMPVVAIASYGPHASLEEATKGLKEQMAAEGFIENKNIRYELANASFDPVLIPQMITRLKNLQPNVMVVMNTPVAQFARGKIRDIPLVYNTITDPVAARLIKTQNQADGNITGSSDRQDLGILLDFVKIILPDARRIGILYSTAESNDTALVHMMRLAASSAGMSVVAIPVEQIIDIPARMQAFNGKVDLIYIGLSNLIQPALPAVAREAKKMQIPLFNSHEQAVRDGLALASFGVSYQSVGKNAGKLVAALLHGADINTLAPLYPTLQDHHGVINRKQAAASGINVPENLTNVDIVD